MSNPNDPALRSWVPVPPDSHFPIQNLPYGTFYRGNHDVPEIGVAIGDHVLSINVLAESGLLDVPSSQIGRFCFDQAIELNLFLMAGSKAWKAIRSRLSELLREDTSLLRDDAKLREKALLPMSEIAMEVPVDIRNFTDFYSSREHATNVGTMLRGPENALQANWLYMPIAYNGRANSVVISGTDLHRPWGQTKPNNVAVPNFGPSRLVDFELEMGCFVGPENELGQPIPIDKARDHLFGMVLVNDWSARDIQKWEYVPLGPFLAKNFGTSISPWVVTLDALEPFLCEGPVQDPPPLPYLKTTGPQHYDINLEAYLQTARMDRPHRICQSNTKYLYWNIAQQLAHHASNGCNMQAGDLLASGTISGPTPDSLGSMLELAWMGSRPLKLPSGETRNFLQDGDRVTMTAWCQGQGYRIGFGEVTGVILPAIAGRA